MVQKIDISTSTILRFVLIILALFFLFLIRGILLMLFVALIIASAVYEPVDWLARHRVRRGLGATIVYLVIILFLALFVYIVFPPLAGQIKILAVNLTNYLTNLGASVNELQHKISLPTLQQILNNTSQQLSSAATNIFGTAINIFGGIVSALFIFVISFYLVVQDKGIKKFIANITPPHYRPYLMNLTERIQSKMGCWLRGQLILMLLVGVLDFIGLTILKVKFALTLALFAALLEIVPYIGPVLGAVSAVALALLQSPFLALLVVALFSVVQQFENYILAPLVMRKVIGLNPLVILISMIIGGKLGGILGVVIAVPLVAAASVFFGDMFQKEDKEEAK